MRLLAPLLVGLLLPARWMPPRMDAQPAGPDGWVFTDRWGEEAQFTVVSSRGRIRAQYSTQSSLLAARAGRLLVQDGDRRVRWWAGERVLPGRPRIRDVALTRAAVVLTTDEELLYASPDQRWVLPAPHGVSFSAFDDHIIAQPSFAALMRLDSQNGRLEWWRRAPDADLLAADEGLVLRRRGPSRLEGLDPATGATLWQVDLPSGWRLEGLGASVVVVSTGEGRSPLRSILGVSRHSGAILWSRTKVQGRVCVGDRGVLALQGPRATPELVAWDATTGAQTASAQLRSPAPTRLHSVREDVCLAEAELGYVGVELDTLQVVFHMWAWWDWFRG